MMGLGDLWRVNHIGIWLDIFSRWTSIAGVGCRMLKLKSQAFVLHIWKKKKKKNDIDWRPHYGPDYWVLLCSALSLWFSVAFPCSFIQALFSPDKEERASLAACLEWQCGSVAVQQACLPYSATYWGVRACPHLEISGTNTHSGIVCE